MGSDSQTVSKVNAESDSIAAVFLESIQGMFSGEERRQRGPTGMSLLNSSLFFMILLYDSNSSIPFFSDTEMHTVHSRLVELPYLNAFSTSVSNIMGGISIPESSISFEKTTLVQSPSLIFWRSM